MNATLGQVVYSKAGRDKGKAFIIVRILDEDFVMVADGDIRPISRPKKKRKKHLRFTEAVIDRLMVILEKGRKVLDSDLRKELHEYINIKSIAD